MSNKWLNILKESVVQIHAAECRCVDRLVNTQMAKSGAHFRCPQHYCAVCAKSGDGVDMVKCIRCPTAYHSCCLPKHLRRLAPTLKARLTAILESSSTPRTSIYTNRPTF
jgi:hypothetical protein